MGYWKNMSSKAMPITLKLEFSGIADFERISRMFEPDVKSVLDPDNHVVKRLHSVFKKAVYMGSVTFLSDGNGDIRTMTIAYHAYVEKDHLPDVQHDHTELGSTLSFIPGYKSASLVTVVLALREWINNPPIQKIAANVEPENIAAAKIIEVLGWQLIKDKGQLASIDAACWRTVLDETDPTGQTGFEGVPKGLESMAWFECNEKVLVKQARVVLDFMDHGGIVNKKTEHFIPVDFSNLEKEGLTRPLLEAIAGGITSRDALAKIAPKHFAMLPDNNHDDK